MSIREEQCNKVCRILDDVLANRPTERDSLIVAVRKAFEQLGNSEQLPSAQPEPHEGEWGQVSAQRYFMSASYFYRCSACGVNNVRNTNYCPHCGAKMKGAEHETN